MNLIIFTTLKHKAKNEPTNQPTNQPTNDIVAGNLKALTDAKTLRKRARQHVEEGAVTTGNAADIEAVSQLLNEALATELVCVLRYKRHCFMAKGIHSESVKPEFLQHANEEMAHAHSIAQRITELGGEPNFHPTA